MSHDDLPTLFGWLCQPHVAEWWRDVPPDLVAVEEEYGPCIDGEDPTQLFVVTYAGRDIGMVQRYLLDDEPVWLRALENTVDITNAAGMDYLIGDPEAIGKGIGTAMASAFAAEIFAWRPVARIVVNVDQANPASWRILGKAGFRRSWAGELDSPDPSDQGEQYLYVLRRADVPSAPL
jgi:aminoglycoside 6'-N-acetyltransferase